MSDFLREDGPESSEENTVSPVPVRQQEQENILSPSATKDTEKAASELPEFVKRNFIEVNGDFYFQNREPAFSFKNELLKTKSTSPDVVKAFVEIAKTNEWKSLVVTGKKDFRRAVWLEAAAQGIEVSGYIPSEVEKAQAARLVDKVKAEENTVAKDEQHPKDKISEVNMQQVNEEVIREAKKESQQTQEQTRVQDGAISGILLNHGKANYQHDPQKEKSYFATIRTDKGERTMWGVGIEKAVSESGVSVGDKISLKKMGKEFVTVKEGIFNDDGKRIGENSVDTHRNKWEAGLLEKAEAFRNAPKEEVLQQHPELSKGYATVAVAEKFAEKNLSPEHRQKFVEEVKKEYANKIEKGEELPAPTVKNEAIARHFERAQAEQTKAHIQEDRAHDGPARPAPQPKRGEDGGRQQQPQKKRSLELTR